MYLNIVTVLLGEVSASWYFLFIVAGKQGRLIIAANVVAHTCHANCDSVIEH